MRREERKLLRRGLKGQSKAEVRSRTEKGQDELEKADKPDRPTKKDKAVKDENRRRKLLSKANKMERQAIKLMAEAQRIKARCRLLAEEKEVRWFSGFASCFPIRVMVALLSYHARLRNFDPP